MKKQALRIKTKVKYGHLNVYPVGDISTRRGTIPGAFHTQCSGPNPWSGAPGHGIVGVVLVVCVFFWRSLCVCCGMKRTSLSVSVAENWDFKPGNLDRKG